MLEADKTYFVKVYHSYYTTPYVSINITGTDATQMEVDGTYTATITYGGEYKYFVFTPTESGYYNFYSYMEEYMDTYGELYNAQLSRITSDDSSGGNGHFKIRYYLEEGETYIFVARYWGSSTTGSFDVYFEAEED